LKIEAREESESSDPPVQAGADDRISKDPDIEEKDINNLTLFNLNYQTRNRPTRILTTAL